MSQLTAPSFLPQARADDIAPSAPLGPLSSAAVELAPATPPTVPSRSATAPGITIERAAQLLGTSAPEAAEALATLRMFLHTAIIAPAQEEQSRQPVGSDFGTERGIAAEAARLLARQLDDIDEVAARVDLRILEGAEVPADLLDLAAQTQARSRLPARDQHHAVMKVLCPYAMQPLADLGLATASVRTQPAPQQLLLELHTPSETTAVAVAERAMLRARASACGQAASNRTSLVLGALQNACSLSPPVRDDRPLWAGAGI